MKKVIIFCGLSLISLNSCKKEAEAKTEEVAPVATEKMVVEECFSEVIKNDTIAMQLKIVDNKEVSGSLMYHFFEKDSNKGEIVGTMKGDTLVANYTFQSEGTSSVREVAFLKKGDTFVEGHGEVVDDNKGKVVFKDLKQVKFDGSVVLSKVDCKP